MFDKKDLWLSQLEKGLLGTGCQGSNARLKELDSSSLSEVSRTIIENDCEVFCTELFHA
jgi:hypothetical protein